MGTHMSETARAFAPSTTAEELESLSGGKGPGQSNAAPVDAVTCGPIPSSRKAYVEIPLAQADDGETRAALTAVHEAGLGAKVRCGGGTPDLFPSIDQLADFVAGKILSAFGLEQTLYPRWKDA